MLHFLQLWFLLIFYANFYSNSTFLVNQKSKAWFQSLFKSKAAFFNQRPPIELLTSPENNCLNGASGICCYQQFAKLWLTIQFCLFSWFIFSTTNITPLIISLRVNIFYIIASSFYLISIFFHCFLKQIFCILIKSGYIRQREYWFLASNNLDYFSLLHKLPKAGAKSVWNLSWWSNNGTPILD